MTRSPYTIALFLIALGASSLRVVTPRRQSRQRCLDPTSGRHSDGHPMAPLSFTATATATSRCSS